MYVNNKVVEKNQQKLLFASAGFIFYRDISRDIRLKATKCVVEPLSW